MDARTAELDCRVRALERQARWHRAAVAGGLALLAGAGLASGQGKRHPPAPELQARRFVLVSAEGVPLAALESTADGGPRLTMLSAGTVRAELGLGPAGAPALRLLGPKGERRVALEASGEEAQVAVRSGADGSGAALSAGGIAPRLAVSDAKGNERLWLAVRLSSPVVQFLDERGMARTGLSTFNGDTGLSVVSQADGKTPGLVLLGKERTVLWSAP
jgi:hypothetical protein